MKYIVKRPSGDTITVTLENLALRYNNGGVRAVWPAKPEDATEWSTVGALLAKHSPYYSPPPASPPPGAATQTTAPPFDSFTSSVCRRYQDAYLIARTIMAIGATVKVIALVIGGGIALISLVASIQHIQYFGGIILGAIIAIPIYVLGVLVSALAQVLKATLDTAVHSSPFLTKEDMAKVMSL